MDKTDLPIGIVGAGIGGLTLAMGLLKQGFKVRVFEKVKQFADIGAGLSLAPNSSKVFAQLDLLEQIKARANSPECGYILHGKTGEEFSSTPFLKLEEYFGHPYYQIHRSTAHQILVDAVSTIDADCVCMGQQLKNFDEIDQLTNLVFTDDSKAQVSCLIACDGVRSQVRKLHFDHSPSVFTGYVAWRALIPMASLDANYQRELSIVNVMSQRQIVHYPIHQGQFLNIAAFAEQDWQIESWTERADIGEMHEVYHSFSEAIHNLIDAIDPDQCFKWALFDREPLPNWSAGKVVLLGDAAHPMLPNLGQGAAMAIEDAWYLSEAIAQFDDFQTAFECYQQARYDRATWVQLESRATAARFATETPSKETFANDKAMATKKLFGFDPIADCAAAYQ